MSPSNNQQRFVRRILPPVVVLAAIAAMVGAIGRGWVCHGLGCDAASMDARILEWLYLHRREWLDRPMIAATWLGSAYVLLPLAILWALGHRADRASRILVPLALIGAALSVHVMKAAVARPRPALHEAIIALPEDLSFPSAHAAQSAAFWLALGLQAQARGPHGLRALLIAVATIVVLAVCTSRMYLQVHYPSDVAAGLLIGIAWAFAAGRMLSPRARAAADA
jgi:undecaprenyl-diphosphatase